MYIPALPELARLLALVEGLEPRSILLVGIGFGELPAVLRHVFDARFGRIHREEWQVTIDGIEPWADNQNALWPAVLDSVWLGDVLTRLEHAGHYDLIILNHALERQNRSSGQRLVETARSRSRHTVVLASQSAQDAPLPPMHPLEASSRAEPLPFELWRDADFAEFPRVTPRSDSVLVTLLKGDAPTMAPESPIPSNQQDAPVVLVWVDSPAADLSRTLDAVATQSRRPRACVVAFQTGNLLDHRERRDVWSTHAPDLGFALQEVAVLHPGTTIAVLKAGATVGDDWLASMEVVFRNRMAGLAGGPVRPLWPDGAEPQAWSPALERYTLLRAETQEMGILNLEAQELLSPAAFVVRSSLIEGGLGEGSSLELIVRLQGHAKQQGLLTYALPQSRAVLTMNDSQLHLEELETTAFIKGMRLADVLHRVQPEFHVENSLKQLESIQQQLGDRGLSVISLSLESRLQVISLMGALSWGAAVLPSDHSAARNLNAQVSRFSSPGSPLQALPWDRFAGTSEALPPAPRTRRYLAAPDWATGNWGEILRGYLGNYVAGGEVELVLLAPIEPEAYESVASELVARIEKEGYAVDQIPDIALQPSNFSEVNLLAWLQRADAVLDLGEEHGVMLVALARRQGLQVLTSAAEL